MSTFSVFSCKKQWNLHAYSFFFIFFGSFLLFSYQISTFLVFCCLFSCAFSVSLPKRLLSSVFALFSGKTAQ